MIIRGFDQIHTVHKQLLTTILLQLHIPNEWFSWDRQVPWLSVYHKDLMLCLNFYLERDAMVSLEIVESLLSYWPSSRNASTPKEVLFLYELGVVMEFVSIEMLSRWEREDRLTTRLLASLSSMNANTLESVLQLWKSSHFCELTAFMKEKWLPTFIPLIVADGQPFWNPTVNKMKALVLNKFKTLDPVLFDRVAEKTFADVSKLAPVSSKPANSTRKFPPKICSMSASQLSKGPSVTMTGVAPWAKQPTFRGASDACDLREEKNAAESMDAFLEKCTPANAENGERLWESALNLPTITFLPNLKFSQLVFGRDLGRGAFGTVKYARAVEPGKTQSAWSEYAAKVISLETIKEHGYEVCINREICVLTTLSHPNICRMVSSFKFKRDAYLILEFAAGGDLHNYVLAHGVLDEEVAKFVAGEIIAGVSAVHDVGFLFGDLKPENCVITSGGHIKLTDFGGARPVTEEARVKTLDRLLERLRDGSYNFGDEGSEPTTTTTRNEVVEDVRLEGTTMYMAPECVCGHAPTYASDSWSLGCTIHFCLAKKPPLWAEDDAALQSRIVSFDVDFLSPQLPPGSRNIVEKLLCTDASQRLSLKLAASHEWFDGMNVFDLYKKQGMLECSANFDPISSSDPWEKRQFSKIWTHMPSATEYGEHFVRMLDNFEAIEETEFERHSPFW